MKIVLVGVGGYGAHYYLKNLLDCPPPSVELVAAVDPFPEATPRYKDLRQRNIPIFPSLESCCDTVNDIELVIVTSPFHFHKEHVITSLQHGAAVLCEKPLCASLSDAREMQEAQVVYNRPVAIGFQWSFSKAITDLKRDILAGHFGCSIKAKAMVQMPRDIKYYTRNGWAGKISGPDGAVILDSPLSNGAAHFLHNLFFLLGDSPGEAARPVRLQGEACRCNDIENFDTAALHAVMDNGADLFFYATHAGEEGFETVFELTFERAVIRFSSATSCLIAECSDGKIINYGNPDDDPGKKIQDSIRMVTDGITPSCSIKTAMPHIMAVNAFQESIGSPTDFPSGLVEGNGSRVFVPGLDDWLQTCYQQECMLSRRLDWIPTGRNIILSV